MFSKKQCQVLNQEPIQIHYSSQFREVMSILRVLAKQCKVCLRYPILRTLESIAKIFRINQIEALFFVHFTKLTDWNIGDEIIGRYSTEIKDFINYTYDTEEYKNFILYLTLISYSLKQCLSYQKEQFLPQALKLCPAFLDVFEKWSQKYGEVIRGINPKDINKLYKSIVLDRSKIQVDYTAVVDEILEISPPYSLTRNQNKLNNRKELKRQAIQMEQVQAPKKKMKLQSNSANSLHATFSDHGLMELLSAGTTNDDFNGVVEGQNGINELGIEMREIPNRELMIMPDNINNPDEDYYEEFNLANGEPFSQQNIIFLEFFEGFKPSDLGHGEAYNSPLKFIFQSGQNEGGEQ